MPFEPLITAVIETTLNTLIKDDPELGRRLSRLKGQVIQIHLKEINKTADVHLQPANRCFGQLRRSTRLLSVVESKSYCLSCAIKPTSLALSSKISLSLKVISNWHRSSLN